MSVRLGVSGSGYLTAHDTETDAWVYIHRLAAVAEHGAHAVFAEGVDTHHVDGVPENNARDNLQPLPYDDHRSSTLNGSREGSARRKPAETCQRQRARGSTPRRETRGQRGPTTARRDGQNQL